MKTRFSVVILCAALLCLTGCGEKLPAAAEDGAAWSKDWITLGNTLGVEAPGHGLTLRDDKLSGDMYYAGWSIGEAQPYTDQEGQETELYDAQLVLLLLDAGAPEAAQDLAAENYDVTDTAPQTFNGRPFTVLTYTFPAGSAFARGVSAFTTFGGCAISAEFACRDTFDGDAGAILADVLTHCHYAAQNP